MHKAELLNPCSGTEVSGLLFKSAVLSIAPEEIMLTESNKEPSCEFLTGFLAAGGNGRFTVGLFPSGEEGNRKNTILFVLPSSNKKRIYRPGFLSILERLCFCVFSLLEDTRLFLNERS